MADDGIPYPRRAVMTEAEKVKNDSLLVAQVHLPLVSYIPRLLPSSSDRDTATLDAICTRIGFRGTQIGRDLGR